jgi:hypothetical protein
VQIKHMDARPALCVSREAVTLDGSRRRGRTKVALDLGIDNRCVRPLTCAVTVSARREGPAADGATGIEEFTLEPSSTMSVPVILRFPSPAASELASWAVSDLRCTYPDERARPRKGAPSSASDATADAEG